MTTKARLTPLGRLLAFLLILSFGAIAGAAGAAATRPHAQAWRCVSVRSGETLWTLAGRAGAPDHREVVQRIIDHNLLGTQGLQTGMAVWVPNEGDLDGLQVVESSNCLANRG